MAAFQLSDLPQRIQDKISVNPETGCWEWTASKNKCGYGVVGDIKNTKKIKLAHRLIFFFLTKEEEKTNTLDHLCRNRSCVNPEHLEQVSRGVNVKRGDAGKHLSSKTHCPKGHPYSGDNLIFSITKGGHQHRECRICNKENHRKNYLANKERENENN